MNKPKTIDEILLKPAHWKMDDWIQAKREVAEWIQSKKPKVITENNLMATASSMAIDEYEQALLSDLEASDE